MCNGDLLLADFHAGASERPEVPEVVAECLTTTVDGRWVVWAHKVARPDGGQFRPLACGDSYPADAVAECRAASGRGDGVHAAPDPDCTCGFHALSQPWFFLSRGTVSLEVALSGRILAYEWPQGGVLFRAERQTVMRVETAKPELDRPSIDGTAWMARSPFGGSSPPDDPGGDRVLRRDTEPRGAGPVRLSLSPSLRVFVCRM